MSSISGDDIFGEEFLNHDTDHTSPPASPPVALSNVKNRPGTTRRFSPGLISKEKINRPEVRPKPPALSPSNTLTENIVPTAVRPKPDPVPFDVPGGSRCVIAVDYGTTFTGVAMCFTDARVARTRDIDLMQDYGDKMSNQLKIPSVISFSPATNGEKQWGMDIAENSVTMMNTKMQFDVQKTRLAELETTLQVLQGAGFLDFDYIKNGATVSGYTWQSPVEVATEYLSRVRERICLALSRAISRIEVDIVITVPVDWSDRATELTYKAFQNAGFNKQTFPRLKDVILVTEPEAASYFTALDNRESGNNFLRKNEIFILCDAGGGTVDAIAYMVKSLDPHLELVQVSSSDSRKCGGSFIDANFKGWLRQAIGFENFAMLDRENALRPISTHTSESAPMRDLMRRFDAKKKTFSSATTGLIKFDLPPPLDNLNVEGRVTDGELTIHPKEMASIFKYCVNKVVELIDDLAQRVSMDKSKRIKNCFLVGGFGESPFLQELLKVSLGHRHIELRTPNPRKSWTATVQGAAIYGIEKARMAKVRCMYSAASSYGIVINAPTPRSMISSKSSVSDPITDESTMSTFSWMVRRGDLIISDATKRADKWFRYVFKGHGDRKIELQIYEYADEDDRPPTDFLTGYHEVHTLGSVSCDLSPYSLTDFGTGYNKRTRTDYYTADLRCKMSVSLTTLEVEVQYKGQQVGYVKLSLRGKSTRRMSGNSEHNYMDADEFVRSPSVKKWHG